MRKRWSDLAKTFNGSGDLKPFRGVGEDTYGMRNPDPGFVLLGTRQQGVPVILRELVLPGGSDLVSPSFTVLC
ncbi:unnamed protein product [Schistosoma curassoni]|uniref:RES domain-containing protein n=1 Tax=Schistosoma curassoni TaxID=6186 RepID=A0A183KN09_9TREM|nr:unnamed protein product [Schistosoma curassoni]